MSRISKDEQVEDFNDEIDPTGLILWCTNISDIKSSSFISKDFEWNFYLKHLEEEDRKKVLSFVFEDDQKRSLVSVMMQRAMIRYQLGADHDADYCIRRTREVCTILQQL
jgi:hypothetical protein